ncbi:hypothetical protein [Streptomyces sp. NPDC059943]|uniref:hypothetical protein n=1 Tax=Streptomyces sp. NPDC059943 TaxID=3347010 RepID=UPI003656C061
MTSTPGQEPRAHNSADAHGSYGIAAHTIGTFINFIVGSRPVRGLPIAAPFLLAVYVISDWPRGGTEGQYDRFALFLALLAAAVLIPVYHLLRAQSRTTPVRAGVFQMLSPLLCLLLTLLSWWSYGSLLHNRQITVTVGVAGAQPVTGVSERTLTLVVDAPPAEDRRARLRLVLKLAEDDPDKPACVHRTTATVTAKTPSVSPRSMNVRARSESEFHLGDPTVPLNFILDVTSPSPCPVRLETALGVLHNG